MCVWCEALAGKGAVWAELIGACAGVGLGREPQLTAPLDGRLLFRG